MCNPEYSLEGLMLKLKLQYFGHLMQRADSLGKTLMLGKIEGRRWRDQQRMRWLGGIPTQWTWVWANSGREWEQGSLACCGPWGQRESDTTEQLSNNNSRGMVKALPGNGKERSPRKQQDGKDDLGQRNVMSHVSVQTWNWQLPRMHTDLSRTYTCVVPCVLKMLWLLSCLAWE